MVATGVLPSTCAPDPTDYTQFLTYSNPRFLAVSCSANRLLTATSSSIVLSSSTTGCDVAYKGLAYFQLIQPSAQPLVLWAFNDHVGTSTTPWSSSKDPFVPSLSCSFPFLCDVMGFPFNSQFHSIIQATLVIQIRVIHWWTALG